MITKEKKQFFTQNIKDKEDRMRISNILDKANRCEASSRITATNFLDLNEKSIVTSILNHEKVKYEVYFPNSFCEKSIIFFVPDYMDYINYSDYITCIKISAKDMSKLKHKDFMGSIYNLGIKNECIGDIFLDSKACYVFFLKEVETFILDNLFKVGNQEVHLDVVELDSEEVSNLKFEYQTKMYIIPSRRIDALLCEVYNLSRKEAKDKIVAGDLYINARECINPSEGFFEGDIVSFRRCGKIKVGEELRTTKSGNICINVNKYI